MRHDGSSAVGVGHDVGVMPCPRPLGGVGHIQPPARAGEIGGLANAGLMRVRAVDALHDFRQRCRRAARPARPDVGVQAAFDRVHALTNHIAFALAQKGHVGERARQALRQRAGVRGRVVARLDGAMPVGVQLMPEARVDGVESPVRILQPFFEMDVVIGRHVHDARPVAPQARDEGRRAVEHLRDAVATLDDAAGAFMRIVARVMAARGEIETVVDELMLWLENVEHRPRRAIGPAPRRPRLGLVELLEMNVAPGRGLDGRRPLDAAIAHEHVEILKRPVAGDLDLAAEERPVGRDFGDRGADRMMKLGFLARVALHVIGAGDDARRHDLLARPARHDRHGFQRDFRVREHRPRVARLRFPARQRVAGGRQDIGAAMPDEPRREIDDVGPQVFLHGGREQARSDRMILEKAFLIGEPADEYLAAAMRRIGLEGRQCAFDEAGFILGGGHDDNARRGRRGGDTGRRWRRGEFHALGGDLGPFRREAMKFARPAQALFERLARHAQRGGGGVEGRSTRSAIGFRRRGMTFTQGLVAGGDGRARLGERQRLCRHVISRMARATAADACRAPGAVR